jgi:hypothetical protein
MSNHQAVESHGEVVGCGCGWRVVWKHAITLALMISKSYGKKREQMYQLKCVKACVETCHLGYTHALRRVVVWRATRNEVTG